MQVNDNLIKTFPKLPEGYRWKVGTTRYPSIVGVSLQKRMLFFWKTVCYDSGSTLFGGSHFLAPEEKARQMFATRFGTDSLIGVTER